MFFYDFFKRWYNKKNMSQEDDKMKQYISQNFQIFLNQHGFELYFEQDKDGRKYTVEILDSQVGSVLLERSDIRNGKRKWTVFKLELDNCHSLLWHLRETQRYSSYSEEIYQETVYFVMEFFLELAKDLRYEGITISSKLTTDKMIEDLKLLKMEKTLSFSEYNESTRHYRLLHKSNFHRLQEVGSILKKALDYFYETNPLFEYKSCVDIITPKITIFCYGTKIEISLQSNNNDSFLLFSEENGFQLPIQENANLYEDFVLFIEKLIKSKRLNYLYKMDYYYFFEYIRRSSVKGHYLTDLFRDYFEKKFTKYEVEELFASVLKKKNKESLNFRSTLFLNEELRFIQIHKYFFIYSVQKEKFVHHFETENFNDALERYKRFLIKEFQEKLEQEINQAKNYLYPTN